MTREAILADDITGAGDSGIHFAAAGRRVALLLRRDALVEAFGSHDTVALSCESRFLEPAAAAREARLAVRDCRDAGADVAYKKIDSTLRGNPGAEIEAILDEGGFRAALVCPAMPKTGRVVRGGTMFLHDRPLDETEAGRDPFNPVASARVAEILSGQTALPIGSVGLDAVRAGKGALAGAVSSALDAGARIIVADAAGDADLAALADLLRSFRRDASTRLLPVGAGGLAEALAGSPASSPGAAPRGRMLAVVGSLTSASMAQIDYAVAHGGFRPLELDLEAARIDPEAEYARLAAVANVDAQPLMLKNRLLPSGRITSAEGEWAAAVFAEAARAVCAATGCSILYATGGSTAMAVMEALGIHSVTLVRECMPGVVLASLVSRETGLRWFISKAGGFGGPETIARLAENTI